MSENCSHNTDNPAGLAYQQVPCNLKNALLLKISCCDLITEAFEIFIGLDDPPPTSQTHLHKILLSKKDKDGNYPLLLSKEDFAMPSEESGQKCTIGARPFTGMTSIYLSCLKFPQILMSSRNSEAWYAKTFCFNFIANYLTLLHLFLL